MNRVLEARLVPLPLLVARLALPAVLGLALGLRLYGLDTDSIWLDEAYSVRVAHFDPVSIAREAALWDTHPPLYYMLLHYWIAAFGDSEAAVRSLSVVFGVLAVFAVYLVAAYVGGRRVGLVAALFAALSPFLVQYSQEARMYALLAAASGFSFALLLRELDRPTRAGAALYVVATAAVLYSHLYGLFVLLAQALVVFVHRRDLRRYALMLAVPFALFSPWLVAVAGQTSDEISGVGSNIGWLERPTPADLRRTVEAYMGSETGLWLAVALGLIAAVGARRWAGVRGAPAIGAWLAVPILVPFAVSFGPIPIFGPRYTIPATLAFFIGLALVTQHHLTGRPGLAMAAAVAAVLAVGTVEYHRDFVKDRWREAVDLVESEALPGEIVLIDSGFQKIPYDYYANREDLDVRSIDEEPAALGLRVWFVVAKGGGAEQPRRPGYAPALSRRLAAAYFEVDVFVLERIR